MDAVTEPGHRSGGGWGTVSVGSGVPPPQKRNNRYPCFSFRYGALTRGNNTDKRSINRTMTVSWMNAAARVT